MIHHYLKIAFRNLLKYKMQTIISIIGLAIGFTCFALATLWIRYEMTYDAFHEGADRTYLIRAKSSYYANGISNSTPLPLATYLKTNYPEIEKVGSVREGESFLRLESGSKIVSVLNVDSAAINLFNIQVVQGNSDFMQNKSHAIGITEELSQELFGQANALGEELDLDNRKYKVCAIVSSWSRHSNIPYQIVGALNASDSWSSPIVTTFVRTRPGTDEAAFEQKLSNISLSQLDSESELNELVVTPLQKIHYSDFHRKSDLVISFQYIVYFCIVGVLVIVSSLFNYLILFVSRIRMRGREMALRKVCGANTLSLYWLYSVEIWLLLFSSMIMGMLLIELVGSTFIQFAQIEVTQTGIYSECAVYLLSVLLISFLFALIPISSFQRSQLATNLRGVPCVGRNNNWFRKSGLFIQLFISLLFVFATTVIVKQLYFLKHTDTQLNQHNVGSVALWMNGDIKAWTTKIAALPMVTEALPPQYFPLVSTGPMMYLTLNDWDEKPAQAPSLDLGLILGKEPFFQFYHFQLLQGEWLTEKSTSQEIVINETAVKKFGWTHPIGKQFKLEEDLLYTVIGVVKDFRYVSPTAPTPPIGFVLTDKQNYLWFRASILFKFKEGSWNECRSAIEALHKEDFPSSALRLYNEEEEYNKHLKSENSLIRVLSVAALVCVLVAVFGIFSLVTLSCEQRRKEMAIRKVNGATVKNILGMFVCEYLLLLLIASFIAFPIGYLIMKQWLESYLEQTAISAWIYLFIFGVIALIILLCIGWRVWQAARQNPAEVIKSE